jgi:hypothetical protein
MNSSLETPVLSNAMVLRQIRPIALLVGLLFALPAAALPAYSVWFVAAGLCCGLGIALYLEFRSEEKEEVQELLATLPAEYEGLGSFKDMVYLEIQKPAQSGQLEFAEPTIAKMQEKLKKQNKMATVVHLAGKNHYLIDCDRFIALLLDKMTEDANKAAEHALIMGIKRYGTVEKISQEVERILSDKSVIEVIKSDFRGNMLMVINRSGEKVIRELIKQAKKAEQPKDDESNVVPRHSPAP